MNAMVYAIFLCITSTPTQAYCSMVSELGTFQSAQDCKATISQVWGPMKAENGRYYPVTPHPFNWAECEVSGMNWQIPQTAIHAVGSSQ